MKKISLLIASTVLIFSCRPSDDKYFQIAALNCNMFSHFGSYEMKEFLSGPPQTYNQDKKVMETATFGEYFKFRSINYAIENYNKVKSLTITDEARPMINASLALYEFCITRYQHEYLQIAKMKDNSQSQTDIDAAMKKFDDLYIHEFIKKYDNAWSEGLIYAKAHGIEVTTVNSSPRL